MEQVFQPVSWYSVKTVHEKMFYSLMHQEKSIMKKEEPKLIKRTRYSRIVETYEKRETVDKYSYVATLDEIEGE